MRTEEDAGTGVGLAMMLPMLPIVLTEAMEAWLCAVPWDRSDPWLLAEASE